MDTTKVGVAMDEQPLLARLACPICGGDLIPLRDLMRCTRCCHSFCESCDSLPRDDE